MVFAIARVVIHLIIPLTIQLTIQFIISSTLPEAGSSTALKWKINSFFTVSPGFKPRKAVVVELRRT